MPFPPPRAACFLRRLHIDLGGGTPKGEFVKAILSVTPLKREDKQPARIIVRIGKNFKSTPVDTASRHNGGRLNIGTRRRNKKPALQGKEEVIEDCFQRKGKDTGYFPFAVKG